MYCTMVDQIMTMYRKDGQEEPLSLGQKAVLRHSMLTVLSQYKIQEKPVSELDDAGANGKLLDSFISAKSIESCSPKTLHYYRTTLDEAFKEIGKPITRISTDDLRTYLAHFQESRKVTKVTLDNVRRILSTFFTWLENEDYILKSPVRKIHKVKITQKVMETLTDEQIEKIREACTTKRDLAIVDTLVSTGMRIGELVLLDKANLNFQERECTVLGKGNKERKVYFDAKAKMHIMDYLASRNDENPALFVSLKAPHQRLTISAIELRIKKIGLRATGERVHPHKFRRTLATMAIDKGMPIEQVQVLLGHVKIDTTLHYAMVKQENVKLAHRKFIE